MNSKDVKVRGVTANSKPAGGGAGATGGYSEAIINLPDDFTFYDAEMVKAENARLKELNRLMVGMLKDVLYCELPGSVSVTIREVLAKAGG